MHDNAPVPPSQVTTADYPEDARQRLGLAATRAREASGWIRRADFAERAGISLRSLVKLEQGRPGVGRKVLDAVGRAIPSWSEDTPWGILKGEPIPSSMPADVDGAGHSDTEEWPEWLTPEWRAVLSDALARQGMTLTPEAARIMRDETEKLTEVERLRAESR